MQLWRMVDFPKNEKKKENDGEMNIGAKETSKTFYQMRGTFFVR